MERVAVVGPSGAGKSEFSRRLAGVLGLPLFSLDNIWWKEDKTHISREEFDKKVEELARKPLWIIDGDYSRTYEIRFQKADVIIFLDYPLEVCLSGINSRIGKAREDIPWKEDRFDPEFKEWIINWFSKTRHLLLSLLDKFKKTKNVVVLRSREEGEEFIRSLSLIKNK